MKNLTWQNPEQLFVAQELINKVKSKCCGIKVKLKLFLYQISRIWYIYPHQIHKSKNVLHAKSLLQMPKPQRHQAVRKKLASSPHLWAGMEDEGLYAPTPKCFKSYLPLKQKLLTHKPSDRTPMCVSIPFSFLIIINLWRYLRILLRILLWILLRMFIKQYIYNIH